VDLYQDRHVVRAVNGTWVIQARSRCPRHGKEGTTMPRKVTAMADLTAIGCQVETTATAAEKVRWLDRDPVIWPDAIALIVRGWTTAASCSGLGGFVAPARRGGVAADVTHLKLNRERVPDSRVLADAGRAGEGHKAASGATLARRVRRKRKIAGAVNLV
jgi:hypothetical protein